MAQWARDEAELDVLSRGWETALEIELSDNEDDEGDESAWMEKNSSDQIASHPPPLVDESSDEEPNEIPSTTPDSRSCTSSETKKETSSDPETTKVDMYPNRLLPTIPE